jgi:hypothetical protein
MKCLSVLPRGGRTQHSKVKFERKKNNFDPGALGGCLTGKLAGILVSFGTVL